MHILFIFVIQHSTWTNKWAKNVYILRCVSWRPTILSVTTLAAILVCAQRKKKKKCKGFKNFTYVYAQRKPFGHTFYNIGSKHIVSEELHVKVVRCWWINWYWKSNMCSGICGEGRLLWQLHRKKLRKAVLWCNHPPSVCLMGIMQVYFVILTCKTTCRQKSKTISWS